MSKDSHFLIGIDIGTTGSRSILFDLRGQPLSSSYMEYPVETPYPGWAEQDPNQWWKATLSNLKKVVDKAKVDPQKIAVISVTGHQPSPVFLDREGNPLCKSLLWMDRRTFPQCKLLRETIGEDELYGKTGLRIDPIYSLSKIMWVRENLPQVFRQTYKILQPKDFIVFRFTGEIFTDYASASATQLLDVQKLEWSPQLLKIAGLSADKLPPLTLSTSIAGGLSGQVASQVGLTEGTPVVVGAGDTTVSAVGTGVVRAGYTCVNIGTSSDVITCVNKPILDPEKRIGYYPHAVPGKYVTIAGANTSGISLRWFRDEFCALEKESAHTLDIDPYDLMNLEAQKSKPGCEGLIFLPYLLGERSPVFDPLARGCFFGLTLRHQKSDFIRSIMEGIGYSIKHRLDAEEEIGIQVSNIIIAGGAAKSSFWRQIVADITGKKVRLLAVSEATCLGAAILGGVGVQIYPTAEDMCDKVVPIVEEREPIPDNHLLYQGLFNIYKTLYSNNKRLFEEIHRVIS